ncbi:MAG: hypothetical protein ACPHXR_01995 [Flavicella sp.]
MKIIPSYLLCFLLSLIFYQNILAQEKDIEITFKRNKNKTVDFFYKKNIPGSYYVKLEFSNLENCYESSVEKVLQKNSGRYVRLHPIDENQYITFSYRYSYVKGNPEAKVDSLFQYVMPYKEGKKIRVIEASSFKEKYLSVENSKNEKSYIAFSSSPDTICSMRKGVVLRVKDEFDSDSTLEHSYPSTLNTVLIEHADGTYASYKGFQKNSISVKKGQTVYPHTKLGVLSEFKKREYILRFSVFYKNFNLSDIDKRNKLSNIKSSFVSFAPYFITENGVQQLQNMKFYISASSKEAVSAEMSRKERRKYKKSPELFL